MSGRVDHAFDQRAGMTKGLFIHRSDSIYDDTPSERYHFPSMYLSRVKPCLGDWIFYYEPVAAGAGGYKAVAKVSQIDRDLRNPGMFYALIEPGSYLEFPRGVPFRVDGEVVEKGLLNEAGRISGRAQQAVRYVSDEDFGNIFKLALGLSFAEFIAEGSEASRSGLEHEQAEFILEGRERVANLGARIVRDRVFRTVVLNAYDERCAFTGLHLLNSGGSAEAEAAHIRPVEHSGPDIVNNGVALSRTVHWMFECGLISLSDDLQILVSRQVNDPDDIRARLSLDGCMMRPVDPRNDPHPDFVRWHREQRFKG